MLAVSSSPAASIVAKATVITALGLICARLARRSRAAVRHALLAAAFGVLLALPVASIVAPPVRIAVPAAAQERTVPAFAGAPIAISRVAPAHASVGVAPVVPRSAGFSPAALLLTGWIAGMALFLLPVVMGLWQVRSLRRSALPWLHGQSVMERLALQACIRRRVEVLLHGALPGPMTCGVVHPAIVLSQDAQTWEGEDLNRAIVHELEHVRRGDWVSHCLARAVCAVYWFHPLVWIAWRQLALEAERSCDDAVLGRSEATAYADQLVGLARRLSLSAKSLSAKSPFLAMANRADLATRVGAVLDSRQRRGRAGTLPVALAAAAAAVLVLTMSPLRVVAAQQSAGADARVTPMAQFSVNTMLVIADVTVSDRNGKKIEGLGANDFALTEDGVTQNISVFEFQKLAATQGTQDSISSYYILGYYTRNLSVDGKFRKIEITGKKDAMAKLDYRAGYYAMKSFTAFGASGNGGVDHSIAPDSASPALVSKQEPEYSELARKAKFQGVVIVQIEVDANGNAVNPRVMRSLGLGLDEKAIEAVKQWKFKPVMKDGKPVTTQAEVHVNFRLL
jgi:TonB family protein